ncbi:hypothetical protein CALVIDRAFT_486076 [Calocera viscosa TUFC12733]|uniref:UbiA prenyltransferase n=1 Tax=Calocera viscosa (strain TUFC12733) TaxID=1330018 RepID=A0A167J7B0_CALVF|nr:hypothetical protein CALVIDRAFT_486076 [Calocera viscosa TUFC12733]
MALSLSTLQYLIGDNLKLFRWVKSTVHTLYLFTKADYHTLFFPIMMFACVAGPVRSPSHLFASAAWVWLHQLRCNINNQRGSITEDAGNKPWRPLASGRMTPEQAKWLHAGVTLLCLLVCVPAGRELVVASALLTITTLLYDQLRMSAHWAKRVVLVVTMYGIFEYGATRVIGECRNIPIIALSAIGSSLLVIGTTAHVGDFPDVKGDAEDGRLTIPIAFPRSSRIITPLLILFWSWAMAVWWELGWGSTMLLMCMGGRVAWRNWTLRERAEDKYTYVLHSIWLLTIHLLPMNARWGVLAF